MSTNKAKAFLKGVLVMMFCLASLSILGQTRFVEVVGSNGYDDGGILCFRSGIRYAPFGLFRGNTHLATFTGNASSSGVQKYTVQEAGQRIRLRVWCNRHNTAHYSTEYTIPETAASENMPGYSESNGCVSAWARASCNFYDAYTIASVRNLSSNDLITPGSTSGARNICVADETDNIISIAVNEVSNAWSSSSFYLITETENGTRISTSYLGSTYQGNVTQERNVSLRDIRQGQNIYNRPIYFRILTRFNESTGSHDISTSTKIGPFMFFRYMPPITNPTVTRSACGNDIISVTLDPSIISQLSNYRFRIRPAGTEGGEQTANIIPLQPGQPVGNRVPLSIVTLPNFGSIIPDEEGQYVMQVYGTELAWGDNLSDIQCAEEENLTIPAKPDELVIGAQLQTYTFVDDQNITHTYHITRNGLDNGVVALSVSNGTLRRTDPFEYRSQGNSWQTVPRNRLSLSTNGDHLFSGLSPGSYRVRAIDNNGCYSNEVPFGPLIQPAVLSITSISSERVTCHQNNTGTGSKSNGQIVATWSGGIGPYSARIQNSSGQTVYSQTNVTAFRFTSNATLTAGNYTIRVTDSQGVYKDTTHQVTSNPEVQLSAVPTPNKCYGEANGSIQLTVSNKTTDYVTFTLTGETDSYTEENSVNYPQLSAGDYTATVTNTNQCTASTPVSLVDPDEITISEDVTVVAKYGDNSGAINFTISGGTGEFDYTFYDDEETISTGTTTEEINISNLYTGYYHLSVTDENSCPQTLEDIHVRQPDAPLSLSFTQLNVDCFGNSTGEVYPLASGGWGLYEYGFNGVNYGAVTTLGGLSATSSVPDTVFVVDSAGIVEKLSVTITQPSQLTSSVNTISHLECYHDNTGAVEFNMGGGTPPYYVSENQTDWVSGNYIDGFAANPAQVIYIRDEQNCLVTETVEITEPDLLEIETDTIVDAFCTKSNGEIHTIIIGGTEAYTHQWRNLDLNSEVGVNSNILADVPSGRYQLVVTDNHQCEATREFSISDFDGPSVITYEIDSVSCFNRQDGNIHITEVTGGMPEYTYYIDGTETTESMEGLSSGNYHIRIIDAKGCQTDEDYMVPQPDDISISGTITPPVCYDSFDGHIKNLVSGSNGHYSYLWSTGSTLLDLENENSGSFSFIVTDWKGCSKEVVYELVPPHAPTANWIENSAILCTGNDLELDGGDFTAYNWAKDGYPLSNERYYTIDEAGVYTLDITNEFGCISTDTFTLEFSDHPLDAVLLLQDSARVSELVEVIDVTWPVPDSIGWSFDKPVDLGDYNEWSQQFLVNEEGIVGVTLRAWYGGCFSDSTKTITIYSSDEEIIQKSAEAMPLILGCKLWPNPNDGNFSLEVKLNEESGILVLVYSLQNHSKLFSKNYTGLKKYEIPFQYNDLNTGVYLIVVKAKSEQQSLKFIIKK